MGISFGFHDDVGPGIQHMLHASADDYRVIFGSHSDFRAGIRGKKEVKQQVNHNENRHFVQTGENLNRKKEKYHQCS